MKRHSCLVAMLCLTTMVNAQTTGIQWATGLSWEQIKQKAKAENKHIFLDIMATWCGPCKEMDKNVFVNETVGKYFNERFISIKVQQDQTKNDNEEIRKWYDDAKDIIKQFDITAYPSLLFLNPLGALTNLQTGYKNPVDFINIAHTSIQPGRIYLTGAEKLKNFIAEYRKGSIDFKELPLMIQLASRLDTAMRRELMETYKEYVIGLEPKQRYTRENIKYWASLNLSSKHQFFQYFLKDEKKIDEVMNEDGFSARVIDKIVQGETVKPFLVEQAKGSGRRMTGMFQSGLSLDTREADWKTLKRLLYDKHGKKIAERAMYTARIEWYSRFSNEEAVEKYTYLKLKKYPKDVLSMGQSINVICWNTFVKCTDMKLLRKTTALMEQLLNASYPKENKYFMDTYANLLYKIGRRDEAIEWQTKALSFAPDNKGYAEILALMKESRPTYGANWDGVPHVNWEGFVFEKLVRVSSEDKKPLNGVSVLNKRTKETQSTSQKGIATIKVSVGDVLVVTFPGFQSQEMKITTTPGYFDLVLKPIK